MRFRNLKAVHWIIFALAFWVIIGPFIADDILALFIGSDTLNEVGVVSLLRWDDFFIGLAISVLALIVVSIEQPNAKTAGLRAMHWLQVGLGAWIATAPFALNFTYAQFTWSHFVTGFFVAIFALIQLNLEDAKH